MEEDKKMKTKKKTSEMKDFNIKISEVIETTTTGNGGTNKIIGYVADIKKFSGYTTTYLRLESNSLKELLEKVGYELGTKKTIRQLIKEKLIKFISKIF